MMTDDTQTPTHPPARRSPTREPLPPLSRQPLYRTAAKGEPGYVTKTVTKTRHVTKTPDVTKTPGTGRPASGKALSAAERKRRQRVAVKRGTP